MADVSLDLELPDVSLEQQTTVELPYEAAMPPELQPVAFAEQPDHYPTIVEIIGMVS